MRSCRVWGRVISSGHEHARRNRCRVATHQSRPAMNRFIPNPTPCGQTRREFVWQVGGGFAGLALIDLLGASGFFAQKAGAATSPLAAKPPHFPAKAKHCVFLFMNGG